MRVAILTLFYGNHNWGGMLQAYALKTVIADLYPSADVDILRCHSEENVFYPRKLDQMKQYAPAEIVSTAAKRLVALLGRKRTMKALEGRRSLFHSFEKEHGAEFSVADVCQGSLEPYDVYVIGSDQVWNPNVGNPYFLGKGLPKDSTIISYGASIARNSLSVCEKKVFSESLPRFDGISVRERTAVELLEDCVKGAGRIEEVLDPTMLLSCTQWDKIARGKEDREKEYAVAFFFSGSNKYRQEIQRYCERAGLELLYIPYARNTYMPGEENGMGKPIYDVGPCEFLHLIRNCRCLFTDSFHGVVFSVIYRKPFCVYERDSQKTKISKNSRLYDLLDKFGLSKRMVRKGDSIDKIMAEEIAYEYVERQIQMAREKSMSFIRSTISDSEE